MKFVDFINEGKLSQDKFEKELISGKHIQIGDDTLWLNSDNEWMMNMKKSDFKTLYSTYTKNVKDAILSEANEKQFIKDFNLRSKLLKEEIKKDSNDIFGSVESLIGLLQDYKKSL